MNENMNEVVEVKADEVDVIDLNPVVEGESKWTGKDTAYLVGGIVTGFLAGYGAYCAGKKLIGVIKDGVAKHKAKKAAELEDDFDVEDVEETEE